MQGLKFSILMGKLKQRLLPGVNPDTDLFLAMFLIRLLPSMREAVGAGNHKTAAAIVKAADTLWDAWAATTPRSQPPRLNAVGALLLLARRRVTKGTSSSSPHHSATTPRFRVSVLSFYPWCFFLWQAAFCLFQSSKELLLAHPFLVNMS